MRRLYSPFQFGLLLTLTFVGLSFLMAGGLFAADTPARVLRASAYAMDITPTKFPVSSSGSMTHRTADSAHDPLHARCLVLDNGKTKIALVTCDSCMIPREIYDAAKQQASQATGIPTDHILCSATHTHTAVTVGHTFQSLVQEDYHANSAHVAYQRVEYGDWVPLRMQETELELGVRRPDAEEPETWRAKSSYLAVDAASQIQETLLKLLNEAAR